MKFTFIKDTSRQEEVIICAPEKNELVKQIEALIQKSNTQLFGYKGNQAISLNTHDVLCFTACEGKVFAITEKEKLLIRLRLYQLEERYGDTFVKINQSCLANVQKIARFDASVSGTLKVIFKNGYTDYVSRRNLKNVKERIGIKK